MAARAAVHARHDKCTFATGAANIALGFELPAVFANRPELAVEMMRHGDRVQDRVWNMPLYDGYRRYLDSNVADIKNSAEG
jgi:leucyl aminopeptidase